MAMVIMCLLNLVLWAGIILFTLWLVSLVLSPFIPGIGVFVPWQPAPAPQATPFRALMMFIGIVLLLNFILCAFFNGGFLPPLVHPHGFGGVE